MSISEQASTGKPSRIPLIVIVAAVAVIFFVVNGWLGSVLGNKFDSPDETANYTFIKRLATGHPLTIAEPLLAVYPYTYPRSFAVAGENLVPGSFLGMIIYYGFLASSLGTWVIPFLTPLLSGATLLAFFALNRRLFGQPIALTATLLLTIHPSFWYYSTRGMYHNAFFFDLIVIGSWLLLVSLDIGRSSASRPVVPWLAYFGAGAAAGAALAVRTSEAFWIGGALLVILIARRQLIDWRAKLWIALAAAILAFLPVLITNDRLFGHPLSFAYGRSSTEVSAGTTTAADVWTRITLAFFPFGLDWRTALSQWWNYGLGLFWWLSLPTLLGVLQELRRRAVTGWRRLVGETTAETDRPVVPGLYLVLYLAVSLWLVLYYGSVEIHDNPDPDAVTIGTSYVRYWLPLYAFGLPFAAVFLCSLWRRISTTMHRPWRRRLAAAATVTVVYLSFATTVFDPAEGLAAVRAHAVEYRRIAKLVASATPPETVIIAGRADKIFFPERKVIYWLAGTARLAALRRLMNEVPVYVYVSPIEAPRVVREQWTARGFTVETTPIVLSDHDRIYRLYLEASPTSV